MKNESSRQNKKILGLLSKKVDIGPNILTVLC